MWIKALSCFATYLVPKKLLNPKIKVFDAFYIFIYFYI